MDILTQLNLAMEYIETHIDDELALADVSGVTTYSPYHFGRLFYYIADMPLSEYIRKRKLSLAAMKLQSSNIRVIDLAMLYGYDSADSFTRAFTKQHGVTPSVARRPGVNLVIFPPLTFQIKIKGVQALNWRIEESEAFEVFGIERIFSNEETGKVPEFWVECQENGEYERLFDTANKVYYPDGHKYPKDDGRSVINAVCGYLELDEKTFPYMICAVRKPDSNTDGFKVAQIPKATWAVFRSEKTTIGTEIPKLFNRAYSEWLPSSGYDKAIGPDMELYYADPWGNHFEEVWIPITKIN
ncbi:MAG: AraC family transcriptional regulator [Lachnospiraceae bacterium]|nr:AraC family transcriptional regulator [Lachnospiraceae bacterium]